MPDMVYALFFEPEWRYVQIPESEKKSSTMAINRAGAEKRVEDKLKQALTKSPNEDDQGIRHNAFDMGC